MIGNYVHRFRSLNSTNTLALNYASKNEPFNGTVILADYQRHGRGQYGRKWSNTALESLLMSVILKPQTLLIKEQYILSMFSAITVAETISYFLPQEDVFIKWPNDIYVGRKKISGILIENIIAGKSFKNSIIGIGVNVSQQSFPDHLPNPVSLYSFLEDLTPSVETVLDILCDKMNYYYQYINGQHYSELTALYQSKLLDFGCNISYLNMNSNEQEQGILEGVLMDGSIVLRSENNQKKTFQLREIKLIV